MAGIAGEFGSGVTGNLGPRAESTSSVGIAQNTNSGDIRGTVTDSTAAVLPGVTATVTNIDTGTRKVLVTNSDGLYDTASILPGNGALLRSCSLVHLVL